jgi:hypothetical protein
MNSANTQSNWSEQKQARVNAVGRQRRIIFNDDLYELDRKDADTPRGLLKRRLRPLVGTQVDTISFSIIEADTPVYDSKVQPIYGADAHGEDPAYWPNIGPNIKALARQGRCPIQIITDFAHEHGMESWAHMRMNDVHDSFLEGWLSLWKKEHRELLVDTDRMLPDKKLYVSANDMTHEQCRQRKLEIVEEVAGRYDIDGFELDYLRQPVLFSRTMRGEPVTPVQIQIITSMMREFRVLADQAASRRGRAIILAVRVPDTIAKARHIGLDIEQWLEQDLVDILIIGGGYAPFTLDLREFVELARPYGVPVIPCINRGKYSLLFRARALASRWHQAGADGIYTFNFGTPFEYKAGEELEDIRRQNYACLYEIGDPQTLVGKDKLYRTDGPVNRHYRFIAGEPPLPQAIEPGSSRRISLWIGDDVETAARAGDIARLLLELHLTGPRNWWDIVGSYGNLPFDKDPAGPHCEIPLSTTLNGRCLEGGERIVLDALKSTFILRYQLEAPPLKVGRNIIEVARIAGRAVSDEKMTLEEVRLSVSYR